MQLEVLDDRVGLSRTDFDSYLDVKSAQIQRFLAEITREEFFNVRISNGETVSEWSGQFQELLDVFLKY